MTARAFRHTCTRFHWCVVDHNAEGTWQETEAGDLFTLHYLDLCRNHADCSEEQAELRVMLEVKEVRRATSVTIGTPGIRVEASGALLRLEGVQEFMKELTLLSETGIAELVRGLAEETEGDS